MMPTSPAATVKVPTRPPAPVIPVEMVVCVDGGDGGVRTFGV